MELHYENILNPIACFSQFDHYSVLVAIQKDLTELNFGSVGSNSTLVPG